MDKKEAKKCPPHEGFQGISFGAMDGIVNILGVMLGLSVTGNRYILALGIIVAGIANSFSNASGMYVSQETERRHGYREIVKSTAYALMASIGITIVLAAPLLFLPILPAVIASWVLGLIMLASLGYFVSCLDLKLSRRALIFKYVIMGVVASVIGFLVGRAAEYLITLAQQV